VSKPARVLPGAATLGKPMKIAILGTRGIPASYSGFETAAEQLARRFVKRGHEVTVYCSPHVVDRRRSEHLGARLVHLPTVRNKYLDTFVHTFLSSLHAAQKLRPAVALVFIAGNSPMCLITRGAGIPTVINVDGLDSARRKWPKLAKSYLRFAERTAPRWADVAIGALPSELVDNGAPATPPDLHPVAASDLPDADVPPPAAAAGV